MSPPDLRTDLPLTLLWGDADVHKERALAQLVEAWLDESEREFGLVRLDGRRDGLEGIINEMTAGSLMAPRRLLVVRDITALSNSEQKALAGRLGNLPAGVAMVMIAEKEESGGYRPRCPVAADLRKAVEAGGQVLQMQAPHPRAMPGWVAAEMQRLGKTIDRAAAQELCEMVGSDIDRLLREVEKISLYVGDRDEVTVEDVHAVSIPVSEENIFELMDAIGRKDAATALSMLDGVLPEGCDTGEYFRFLAMVQRQIRLIWQARFMRQCRVPPEQLADPPEQVASRLPTQHNFPDLVAKRRQSAREYTEQAARFSDGQLARGLDRIYQADLQLKGAGGRLDPRTVMELLIADLCR